MAEAAQIGANFSNYQGNPNLGGAGLGVFEIDTSPLANLAAYTFSYNSAQFAQKQKDIEAKAKELADITAYDLTSAIPKDREEIQKGYNKLFKMAQDDPTILDYKNNQKGWMEWNKAKNQFANQLAGGKVRSVLYSARQKEIAQATTQEMKYFLQGILEKEANATDLMTPLKHTQLYDIAPVEVTAPPMMEFDVSTIGSNYYATRTEKLPDMASVKAQAAAKNLGLLKGSSDPNSLEFQAQSASGKLEPIESAKNISQVILSEKYQDPKFRNSDGTLNLDLVLKDNANNPTVSGVLSTVKQYNNKMDEIVKRIKAGHFNDKFNGQLSFGGSSPLVEEDFSKIDLSDGLSSQELLQIKILGLAEPSKAKTDISRSGDAIAREQMSLQERMNNADNVAAYVRARLPYDEAKIGQKDAAGNQVDFGNLIYGINTRSNKLVNIEKANGTKFKNVRIKNGVMMNEKGQIVPYSGDLPLSAEFFADSIPVEYSKYVGGTKVDEEGNVVASSAPNKLLNNNGNYKVRVENGEITGIYTEGVDKGSKGSLVTVADFDHITRQAAQKGATKARPADPNYGNFGTQQPDDSQLTDFQYFQKYGRGRN